MSIDEIRKDLIEAQKTQDELTVSVLRMLLAAITNKEKEKRIYVGVNDPELSAAELDKMSKLNEEELKEVIASEVKKRRDSVSSFEKGGRSDLAEKEQKELEILKKYLPPELTESEIRKIVETAAAEIGANGEKDLGRLMQIIIPQTKNRADGYLVGQIVKEVLGK
ncbi:MAG TPA: GatB/YqeY domain-containing protein [Candidatus Pacearchaeota archaeon]|jgi:hypothetical protein|nr:GatB/YqeY domain-containing protein [Candidatus Pacearchaeota archaeon]HRR94685.1 GatB/YqeY domain-containing protein [Candidatus Paceibacterota bacterium]HPC30365.1 GatB/YqeY domain-containing protein [Candidatus Pacearchaeota archaeon]HQG09178.1 GatB/YqeY domain-containing protein [Candidatus Pacearchaeota archaeon]HQH20404.1 GatB/YqeY domain-containing protein [Candidatus Pacearchaeota archaeon]